MKTLIQPLRSFVNDFTLTRKDGIICFDAIIYFSSQTNFVQLPTEVQVVTMEKGNTDVELVYLLSIDVEKHSIPDMYAIGKEEFRYIKDTALVIKGESPFHGKYVLSIHPTGIKCEPETIKEIHGRMYN